MTAAPLEGFRYLPISPSAVRWGLYLVGCGHLCVPAHGQHPPAGHPELYAFSWDRGRVLPEYQAIYLVRGKGAFESAQSGRRTIVAGDLLLLFPGEWHRYRPARHQAWETWWIGFNGSYARQLADAGFLQPAQPILHVGESPALLETYRRVVGRVLETPESHPLLGAAGVMEVLARALAPTEPEAPQPASLPFARPVLDRYVAEAVRLIWSHGSRTLSVADVVAHFPLTRRSLERRFRRAVGHPILQEIVRCRVERAKHLLAGTDLPLKGVAHAAGFPSAERMSKVLQRCEGVSPQEYRRRLTTSPAAEQ